MNGDPRNQALLLHEDGWAPHSTSSKHSIAAITVTHGCMSKQERSNGDNARLYSFIPVDQLPKDTPHKYDCFFEPLFDELEALYINGMQVFFRSSVSGFSPANDTPVLRVVPLLTTTDMKAHAEIGLTAAGGRKGCRHCEVVGEYFPARRHYYYGNFLLRYRFRPELRTVQRSLECAMKVDSASSAAERKSLVREFGVTGVSSFYRLYTLCGFDPVHDMVVDTMHALCLNLIRSELEHRLLLDLGTNVDCAISDRSPQIGGLLDRKDLACALDYVPWTTELKSGRLPFVGACNDPNSKHRLGHWKSEEFGKFALVAPFVLHSLVPKLAYI